MVRHRSKFGALEIKYDGQIFLLGVFFSEMCSPREAGKQNLEIVKIRTFLDFIDGAMVFAIFHMQL